MANKRRFDKDIMRFRKAKSTDLMEYMYTDGLMLSESVMRSVLLILMNSGSRNRKWHSTGLKA